MVYMCHQQHIYSQNRQTLDNEVVEWRRGPGANMDLGMKTCNVLRNSVFVALVSSLYKSDLRWTYGINFAIFLDLSTIAFCLGASTTALAYLLPFMCMQWTLRKYPNLSSKFHHCYHLLRFSFDWAWNWLCLSLGIVIGFHDNGLAAAETQGATKWSCINSFHFDKCPLLQGFDV